jgi:hypothetical protein
MNGFTLSWPDDYHADPSPDMGGSQDIATITSEEEALRTICEQTRPEGWPKRWT